MTIFNYLKLAKEAAEIAEDKKCSDVVVMNIKKLTAIADYFVVATAESSPQRTAVVNTIEKTFKENGGPEIIHREGRASQSWSIIDYGGLIIHIMSPQARNYFALEKIWAKTNKSDS